MGAQRHEAGWTEPRVARLKKLWLEGKSASEIAADLKGGVTRNACIAKIHRLGLSSPDRAKAGNLASGNRKAPKPRPDVRVASNGARTYAQPAAVPLPPEPVVKAQPRLVGLLELGKGECKWPIGGPEGGQRFCGLRQHEGTPYCREHAGLAYSNASALAKHSTSELVRSLRRFT